MRKSIRYQYTVAFAAVIIVILFSIWCVNNLFLEKFYIHNKKQILKKSYVQIDEMMKSNPEFKIGGTEEESDEYEPEMPEDKFLRELGEKYNISIFVQDNTTGEYLSTEPRGGRFMELQMRELFVMDSPERPPGVAEAKGDKAAEKEPPPLRFEREAQTLETSDNYTIQRVYDKRAKSYYLQSVGHLSNPDITFIMSAPLSSIQESVALSNRFLTFISILALLFGSVVIFIITKRVATPILELSKLSEKMSDLDFEVKYEGKAENEIGVLGSSMNQLSDKLKQTMGELKSANMKLQSDIEQKVKIDEMRKDFVSNVSHELKTPITIIHGYAEGLVDGMCRDEDGRNFYYQVILNESDKMTTLVKQLLNLSDLEFGFDPPEIERFDMVGLMNDILSSSEVLFREKGAAVEFISDGPAYVWADEFKIEQVINNYLSNALNHLDGERRIRIEILRQGDLTRVSVYNTGKNIPEKDLPNLWTKFYKVDKARTREYGGSGIGLSIVKAIMDSHHKECGVENKEDGVEFWFTV